MRAHTSLARGKGAHMLDILREQEGNFAFAVHALDRSHEGVITFHRPWLSRDVFKPEQLEPWILSSSKTFVDFLVVVVPRLWANEPRVQRSEVFLQHEGAIFLLREPTDVDVCVVEMWLWLLKSGARMDFAGVVRRRAFAI